MEKGKMVKIEWRTERRRVDELVPHKGNPRKMSEKQAADLKASLEKFNLVEIPAVNTDNRIIAGHMRLAAMKQLGRGTEEIEVRVPNRKLTAVEEKEYLLRSNKNVGEWDWDELANFDEELLRLVGFDSVQLDKILKGEDEDDDFDLDQALDGVKTSVKEGQIFILGDHRIMCGDATNSEHMKKLMGGGGARAPPWYSRIRHTT